MFLITNAVASHTILKRLLKLLANLMINIMCRDGKTNQAIGKIPSLNGTVGCHIISVQRTIAMTLWGEGHRKKNLFHS